MPQWPPVGPTKPSKPSHGHAPVPPQSDPISCNIPAATLSNDHKERSRMISSQARPGMRCDVFPAESKHEFLFFAKPSGNAGSQWGSQMSINKEYTQSTRMFCPVLSSFCMACLPPLFLSFNLCPGLGHMARLPGHFVQRFCADERQNLLHREPPRRKRRSSRRLRLEVIKASVGRASASRLEGHGGHAPAAKGDAGSTGASKDHGRRTASATRLISLRSVGHASTSAAGQASQAQVPICVEKVVLPSAATSLHQTTSDAASSLLLPATSSTSLLPAPPPSTTRVVQLFTNRAPSTPSWMRPPLSSSFTSLPRQSSPSKIMYCDSAAAC
ncbi:hypothetical protein JCM11641_003931 [Rhodosporidiobolus odoratus]